jgi:hypothetical protein
MSGHPVAIKPNAKSFAQVAHYVPEERFIFPKDTLSYIISVTKNIWC